jgi:FkbM family methyltransferase
MRRAFGTATRAAWPLTWPVRWYWAHSDRQVGKKLVVDHVLKRLVPARPAGFETELPGGGRVFLHHRDDIGLVVLMSGSFEEAEIKVARSLARAGTTAIDVGANVGIFTVPLALAVGTRGRVLAVEPSPENVAQLEHNIRLNELENVDVHAIALAAAPGEVALQLGADPAFHSTATVVRSRDASATTMVPAETLDGIWRDAGSPHVSFLKVDTEGAELDVLRGGRDLVETWRMPILLEAKEDERLRALDALLVPLGYKRTRPRAFAVGNYLYGPQVRTPASATT